MGHTHNFVGSDNTYDNIIESIMSDHDSEFTKLEIHQGQQSETDDLSEHQAPLAATVLPDGRIIVNSYLDEQTGEFLRGPSMQQIHMRYKLACLVGIILMIIVFILGVVFTLLSKPWVDGEGLQ